MDRVWVSDRPLDNSEGASGETLLQIEVAEPMIAAYEWVKEGKPYREWLIPAAILNGAGQVKLADSGQGARRNAKGAAKRTAKSKMYAPMNREIVRARLPLDAAALLLRLGGKDVGTAHLSLRHGQYLL